MSTCPDCVNGLQPSTHVDEEQPMRLCSTCDGSGLAENELRTFGDPPQSGGDWIRGKCQRATFVTPACSVGAPECPTCEVAAEYDRLERLVKR
jgi:hypothetical protein